MLIAPLIEVPVMVSLVVIITVIAGFTAASLWRQRAGRGQRSRAVPS
jgi:hypothetical protein